MHPVLFTLPWPGPDLEVATYRATALIAAIVAVALAVALARRQGLRGRDSLFALAAGAAGFFIGARLWHAVTNPSIYAEDPGALWSLNPVGLAMFGGAVGGAVAVVLAARRLHLDTWRLFDCAAPALGVGIAIARVGCFCQGCCFGNPSSVAWAVKFPAGSPSHFWQIATNRVGIFAAPLAVHPTQLYELGGALLCAGLALALLSWRRIPSGVPVLAFVAAFSAVRWVNWTLRVPPHSLERPGMYPVIYAVTIAVCAGLAVLRWRGARQLPT